MKKTKEQKGITLISLVITIILLLILATVAINLAVDSDGLFRKAGQAANSWNESVATEGTELENLMLMANSIGGGLQPEEPDEAALAEFYQNGGSIEVKFVDKNNQRIENPLAPVLGTGMTAVKWNGTEWAETNSADTQWYDYSQSKWANAKTADGSMWVWIPRYAYEITYTLAPYTSYTLNNSMLGMLTVGELNEELHEIDMSMPGEAGGATLTLPAYPVEEEATAKATGNQMIILYEEDEEGEKTYNMYMASGELSSEKQTVGYSNSRGIVTTEGKIVAGLEAGVETSGKYIVHPAFGTNLSLGGWSEPLAGIWVAKYEMSMETNGATTITDVLTTSSIKMVSKPNESSWRNIQIGNIYTNCYNYDRTNESHLMKNSEWGAVAYLSYSQYGTNGVEIAVDTSYITGAGGVASSSTGNETGIYDLSGGATEYVATYDKLGGDNLATYGSSFADGTSTKYATAYSNGTSKQMRKEYILKCLKNRRCNKRNGGNLL